jgi:hypothetical protein
VKSHIGKLKIDLKINGKNIFQNVKKIGEKKMKKIKLSKEMFGENAIFIEAILNGLIAQNRRKENDNRKKKK